MNLASESARAFAQSVLNRIKGTGKSMDVSGIDWCRVTILKDGFCTIEVGHEMINTDMLVYTYPCKGELLGEEERGIRDAYGYEVA